MSKELEKSIKWLSNVNNFENVSRYSKEYFEHFNKVVKALTPPTADKVCEALLKHSNFNEVNYNASTRGFYSNDTTICYLGINYQETPIIIFEYDLPPHLTTLISRFYEGVLK